MITDSEDRSMIAELERIIQAEEAKPEAERNTDLIDDCIREIAELKGVKAHFSDEEIKEITDKLIKKTDREKRKKRLIRYIAGIAAVFVLVGGVTACAINPALINWLVKVVRMPFYSSVEQDMITYVHQGDTEKYQSIEELVASEKYEILYPSILPNGSTLKYVELVNEDNISFLVFQFSDQSLHYTIHFNFNDVIQYEEAISQIETDGHIFYVFNPNNCFIAISEFNEAKYVVEAASIQDLVIFIGGLKEFR